MRFEGSCKPFVTPYNDDFSSNRIAFCQDGVASGKKVGIGAKIAGHFFYNQGLWFDVATAPSYKSCQFKLLK
jgi:hypothetical protein